MQPGLALQSARSMATCTWSPSHGREHGGPRHNRPIAATVSSRTGLTANGLAPGAASLSALSRPEYARKVACRTSKILYGIAENRRNDGVDCVPEGRLENSPAIHRWGHKHRADLVVVP